MPGVCGERENVPRWGHSCTGVVRDEAVVAMILGDDWNVQAKARDEGCEAMTLLLGYTAFRYRRRRSGWGEAETEETAWPIGMSSRR
jgi:hypothetical protein